MNLDHKLLSELKKFKMLSTYTPGRVLNEQNIISEKTQFYGKTYVYYNETENSLNGVTIGYIDDKTQNFYPNKNGAVLFDLQKNFPYKINGSDKDFNRMWNYFTSTKKFMFDIELEERVGELESQNSAIKQTLQDVQGADWKGGTSGSIIFISSKAPAAANIKGPDTTPSMGNVDTPPGGFTKTWNLLYAPIENRFSIPDNPKDKPKPTPNKIEIEDSFTVNGARKTFCDNVVDVDLTNPDNKEEFDKIVTKIKNYITAPDDEQGVTALSKFKMSIMGQADSAAPGWTPGPPCNSRTSEIGHDYGGMEKKPRKDRTSDELHKMNMYLATMRARNYKNLIIEEIKKQTGLTIQIEELPAKEYYGEGESKRGSQWRSMVLTSTSPEHEWVEEIPIDPNDVDNSDYLEYEKLKSKGYDRVILALKTNDTSFPYKYFSNSLVSSNGSYYVEAIPENLKFLSKYGPNEYSISNASVSMGGKFKFIINTNDGNEYIFEPKLAVNGGEASNKIANSAILGDFNCKAQFIAAALNDRRGEWEYASFVTEIQGKPFDDALDMYDENSQITINGRTYYKIVSVGFQLIGKACQAYDFIDWPEEEEVKSMKKLKQSETYSDEELLRMKKAIKSHKNTKIEKVKRTLGAGEEIQNDINIR